MLLFSCTLSQCTTTLPMLYTFVRQLAALSIRYRLESNNSSTVCAFGRRGGAPADDREGCNNLISLLDALSVLDAQVPLFVSTGCLPHLGTMTASVAASMLNFCGILILLHQHRQSGFRCYMVLGLASAGRCCGGYQPAGTGLSSCSAPWPPWGRGTDC